MSDKKKVVVGMSGGVDSSVCALLLKEQGYEVIGATMQIWDPEKCGVEREGSCCGLSAVEDARAVAACLDIPYYVLNLKDIFRQKVIDNFTESYIKGITPNPCIACNRYVKWEAFMERCRDIGADYIATGHYARVIRLPDGRYTIRRSVSDTKDQTYVLYNLTQDQLAHTLMPVGEFEKTSIRELALKAGLPVANKSDSQDICFIEGGDYAKFIKDRTGSSGKIGNFIDREGVVIGKHEGTVNYTIGQRKGLGIALGHRAFVCDIDADSGDITLGTDSDLYKTTLFASGLNHMGDERFDEDFTYSGKVRYSQQGTPCKVKYVDEDTIRVDFETPVRAATPGQAVVLYRDDYIAGGGTIIKESRQHKV